MLVEIEQSIINPQLIVHITKGFSNNECEILFINGDKWRIARSTTQVKELINDQIREEIRKPAIARYTMVPNAGD